MSFKRWPWLVWIVTTLLITLTLARQLDSEDKRFFLPGRTSDGHYQIELKCQACHGGSFSDKREMQKNCLACHGGALKAVRDSHPTSRFADTRTARRFGELDARYCVTCHVEHKPEITRAMGVTQPEGFCIHCHRRVVDQRPSHAGMNFVGCASAGCHNYHDNRALQEDFLARHRAYAAHKRPASMLAGAVVKRYHEHRKDFRPLTIDEYDAPDRAGPEAPAVRD